MSYWFEQPPYLGFSARRIDLRNSRKRDRLRAKSETASAERALAPMLLAVRTETLPIAGRCNCITRSSVWPAPRFARF